MSAAPETMNIPAIISNLLKASTRILAPPDEINFHPKDSGIYKIYYSNHERKLND